MLRIVVFGGGHGGELFADYLEEALPVVEVIRVIDWQNAEAIRKKARTAREIAEAALKPHLGKVDLIILANHLLTLKSLKYFRRKYKDQRFLGLFLEVPKRKTKRDLLILTTRAVQRTMNYWLYVWRLGTRSKTLALDAWPAKIDEGSLTDIEIREAFETAEIWRHQPRDVVLVCAQFGDIKPELRGYFKGRIKIYDGFEETLRQVCRMLKIRGGVGKRNY